MQKRARGNTKSNHHQETTYVSQHIDFNKQKLLHLLVDVPSVDDGA
jgi:hypothetical protein